MTSGRMRALKQRQGEQDNLPLTPEGQLRKCIRMLTNLPDEEVDDLLVILDGTPVTQYETIKRFACDMDRVRDNWKQIIYLFDIWMKKEWSGGHIFRAKGNVPPELHHIPVAIEDRISAITRIEQRNKLRRAKSKPR